MNWPLSKANQTPSKANQASSRTSQLSSKTSQISQRTNQFSSKTNQFPSRGIKSRRLEWQDRLDDSDARVTRAISFWSLPTLATYYDSAWPFIHRQFPSRSLDSSEAHVTLIYPEFSWPLRCYRPIATVSRQTKKQIKRRYQRSQIGWYHQQLEHPIYLRRMNSSALRCFYTLLLSGSIWASGQNHFAACFALMYILKTYDWISVETTRWCVLRRIPSS